MENSKMPDLHLKAYNNTRNDIETGNCWAVVIPRSAAGDKAVKTLGLPQDGIDGGVVMRSADAVAFVERCERDHALTARFN
jgi:hypothetical protein